VDLLLVAVDDLRGRRVLGAELVGADAVSGLGWPVPDDGSSDAALTGVVDDERWMRDVVELRDGLRAVRGLGGEPVALLRGLDSPALAAAAGLLLRSAARRTPAVLGGHGAAAAALLARGQAWACSDWWQLAPVGGEALAERVAAGLQLTPLAGMTVPLEDGTAALLAADALCAAAALLGLPTAAVAAADSTGEPGG
jgi:nicotinate-nucleotide--dimethylbenzimidazole phosphoribosyltransferase